MFVEVSGGVGGKLEGPGALEFRPPPHLAHLEYLQPAQPSGDGEEAAENGVSVAAGYHHLVALHHQHLQQLHHQHHQQQQQQQQSSGDLIKDEFGDGGSPHNGIGGGSSGGGHSRGSTPAPQQQTQAPQPSPVDVSPPPRGTKGRGRKRAKFYNQRDGNPLSWPLEGSAEMFGSKAELQLHSQLHMREAKPYKCSQCTKAFANSSYLSQHTRIHLGIKPYRCEICQRKFTQLSHLQQHIRTHTGDKPYKCRHIGCNKAFSQLSNLQSHSRCHQTDKPYKCNSCYKCFTDEPSLLEHIPKHKESKHLKTHICQYCGKSYTQETYLTKHMQKHAERTDKRPPIPRAANANGTSTPGGGGNNNVGTPGTNGGNSPVEHGYWSKEGMENNLNPHDPCLQNSGMNTPEGNRLVMEEVRQQQHMAHQQQQHQPVSYESTISSAGPVKTTTSAFTPIQSAAASMLPLAAAAAVSGNQLMAPPTSRGPYHLAYDPISFPKAVTSVAGSHGHLPGSGGGGGGGSFPNQLISLHQIRNYAHQPSAMAGEHLLGLKEKTQ